MPLKVTVIESERGWGQRIDEVIYFRDADKAQAYVDEFNSHNTEAVTPDWYMVAKGPVYVRELPASKKYRD